MNVITEFLLNVLFQQLAWVCVDQLNVLVTLDQLGVFVPVQIREYLVQERDLLLEHAEVGGLERVLFWLTIVVQ